MIARYDAFNRFEHPKLTLCSPAGRFENGRITETIGVINYASDEEIVANFNELSSLNFACYKVDEEHDPDNIYNQLSEKQCVFVDDIGFFCITDISENIDEEQTYKDIRAQSCETEIKNKTIPASFFEQQSNLDYAYNTTYKFDTLIELLVMAIPGWNLVHVDDSLNSKYRTFEDVSEDTNILSFMLTNMQEAYECIFTFDIINRNISVYSQDNYVHMTDIHLSHKDFVESLTVSRSAEDIYTSLHVVGGDNLSISGVNPIGTNALYKYDFYFDSMPQALATKVEAWQDLVKSYEDDYYDYNVTYYAKLGEKSNTESALTALSTQIDMYQRCKDNIVASSGLMNKDDICFTASGETATQIANLANEYNSSGTDITVTMVHVDSLEIIGNKATTQYTAAGTPGAEIVGCYVKDSNGIYIKQLYQSTLHPTDYFTYNPETKVLTFHYGQFSDGTQIGVFYHPTDSSAPEDVVIVTELLNAINDEIASLNFQHEAQAVNLDTINAEIAGIREDIESVHEAVSMNTYFTNEERGLLSLYTFEGEYKDDYITITDSMTYPNQLEQIKLLYDRAVTQLDRISTPTEQFSLDVESFVFQKDFRDWTEQLETGCLINVEIYPDEVIQLFLSNFTVNYSDASLSMTFGNRYNKFDPQSLFDNVLGNISRTSNSINFIKDTIYPITSGEYNAIKSALANIRLLSAGQALTSQYQDFIIDSTGITGKKRSGETEFFPEQIKIVNNMIALTDDAWETCKVAIGKILLGDGSYCYGVNAEVIMGDIILGNELHILGQNAAGDYVDIFSVMNERIEAHVPEIHAVTTNTGYTFNDNGLMIERTDSEIVNVLNNEGMEVSLVNNSAPEEYTETIQCTNNKLVLSYPAIDVSAEFDISVTINDSPVTDLEYDQSLHTVTILSPEFSDGSIATVTYHKGTHTSILTAKNDGVTTKNLTAKEFLMAGMHTRFENYATNDDPNRTAIFFV